MTEQVAEKANSLSEKTDALMENSDTLVKEQGAAQAKTGRNRPIPRVRWEWVNCNLCGQDDWRLYHRERLPYFGQILDFQIVKCRHCDLVYTNPRLADHNATYLWDDSIKAEDFARHDRAKAAVFDQALARIIRWRQRFGFRTPGRLLDIGCGSGHFLARARQQGFRGWGIEPAPAPARYATEVLKAPVIQQDVLKVQLPLAVFDVITAWDVIEHLPDPYDFLRRCGHWLRPGGISALRFPSPSWQKIKGVILQQCLLLNRPAFGATMHLYFFSERTFRKMAHRAGLEILHCQTTRAELNTGSMAGNGLKMLSHLTLRGIEILSRRHWGNLEIYCRKVSPPAE